MYKTQLESFHSFMHHVPILSTSMIDTSFTLKVAFQHKNDRLASTFKALNTPPHQITPHRSFLYKMGNCFSGLCGSGGGGGGGSSGNSRCVSVPGQTSRPDSGSSDQRYRAALRNEYEMTRGRRYSRHDSAASRHDGPLRTSGSG